MKNVQKKKLYTLENCSVIIKDQTNHVLMFVVTSIANK